MQNLIVPQPRVRNCQISLLLLNFLSCTLSGSLKLPMLLIYSLEILQKWLVIHEIIDWNGPVLEFSAIFVRKNWSKNFQHGYKSKIIHLQRMKWLSQKHGFLSNALSFLMPLKIPSKFTEYKRKLRKFTVKVNHKMSIKCRLCRRCQQRRSIFPLGTDRISTKLHR